MSLQASTSPTTSGECDMKKVFENKKILVGIIALISVIAVVTVSSFFPFIIKPDSLTKSSFWTNELLAIAIVVISMVATMFIAMAWNEGMPNSNIAIARDKFDTSVPKITNPNAFFQWVREVMQPDDIKQMHIRLMRENGIKDYSVLDLDRMEIKELEDKPCEFNGRRYSSLSKEQVKTLLDIKDGKIGVTLCDPSYYMTVKSTSGSKTISERTGNESKKKGLYITQSFASKLILTLMVAMIFSSLVYDQAQGGDTASNLMKFTSRLVSMGSGMFSGFILGCQINDIDAEYVEMRVIVHEKFLNDTSFKAKTDEEIANEEYNNYHKNDKQEEKDVKVNE